MRAAQSWEKKRSGSIRKQEREGELKQEWGGDVKQMVKSGEIKK
jgi:hypothetical protein